MPFIDDILKYKSLSIVGMEKNTGKTETLNYVIRRLNQQQKTLAVTSIGIDGEHLDLVTNTHKPEIRLFENMLFVTSEKHYHEKQLTAEILDVSTRQTALGRLITGRVKIGGKIILSGPGNTVWLKKVIQQMDMYNVATTLVDGALSRRSFGSPSVTESLILTTGAALSPNIAEVVRKTKFVYSLINLPQYETPLRDTLLEMEHGIWSIDKEQHLHNLHIPSIFLIDRHKEKLSACGNILFAGGMVSDKLLDTLRLQKNISEMMLIVKDFTRIFANAESVNAFLRKGGKIKVLLKTKLIALCINPVSPTGYVIDSGRLKSSLEENLHISVYNIKE
ncbi:MAG: hypothetical protein LBH82_02060 [Bacteroidales bacterium]|jgi:hypothetical protein|nr:hypothetical protein [Bacteroidales bacterium]